MLGRSDGGFTWPALPPTPDAASTTQAAHNVLTDLGQRAASVKSLITDRAGQFTDSFDAVFTAGGITILISPHSSGTGTGTGTGAWLIRVSVSRQQVAGDQCGGRG